MQQWLAVSKIFDRIRKKHVARTPEEVVRQELLNYLIDEMHYPEGLIMVEHSLTLNGLSKRCDILVCDRNGKHLLMVECKAPHVPITNKTFEQLARYNLTLQVPYLVATNGQHLYCCKVDIERQSILFLAQLPLFDELRSSVD